MCWFPSFARKINVHPTIKAKMRIKLLKTTGFCKINVHRHQNINPMAMIAIPRSSTLLGLINSFDSSPVLDEVDNLDFLIFFKFSSSYI